MNWNWQQPDWPEFRWDATRLARAEEAFLLAGGRILGMIRHLEDDDRERLFIESMTDEAVTTSEIEGEVLARESVQSSIRRQLGLAGDGRRIRAAEQGIGELMVHVFRSYAEPIDDRTLFAWHRSLMQASRVRDLGRYRTHREPMQVVSGRLDAPQVHFEAPPSTRVPEEMKRFLAWFNDTSPGKRNALPALTRAGIAHLHFESIHPFEDGNGRIGRAIAEKTLAQSLGQPAITAIAATILVHRKEYYRQLALANRGNEITGWLAWFAGIGLEAQERTAGQIEFVLEKARFLGQHRDSLNERQMRVLLRMLREGPGGFKGGLSASNYIRIARTSSATATRDLADMVERGALHRTGEKKHTRYHLPIAVKAAPKITLNARGEILKQA